ncbi:MAG: hypothetical protein ACHQUA_00560 [Microgenomates group bacterium]
MKIDRLPPSVLNGDFLHCQPVEGGAVVEAPILSSEGLLPTAKVVIVCAARIPRSKCKLMVEAGINDGFCQYYQGDSLGDYQIIGPGMDKKLDSGYKNTQTN